MQPTIQLGDLSRNFAAEVFEARALVGTVVSSPIPLNVGIMELRSRALGGIVIESMNVSTIVAGTNGAAGFHLMITNAPLLAGTTSVADPTNIGGRPVKSTMRVGHGLAGHGSDTPWYGTAQAAFLMPGWELQPTSIWVPPGSYLTLGSGAYHTGTGGTSSATINMVWREIPEIQGVAG